MPDSEHLTDDLTAGTRFAPSVPARHEPFLLKGCGALDWGMQSRLARIFRPDTRRAVMLAIDHGYFQGPTTGLERVDLSILPLLPYADALMTTRGMVRSTVPPASRIPIACPVPLVMAGGKKLPERDALTMAYNAIENGAAGVDMGRNIFQSDTPQAMIRAVGAVVHESVKPADAYEQYLRQAASS
jgi:DhnA family fructose-bisphosphate aldolase class Ia